MADDDTINWQNLSGLISGGQQAQQTQQSTATQATNFDSQTSKYLDSLQPDFADKAKQWIQGMRDNGYDPVLTYGYRTPQEQQVLYQKHLAGGPQAVAPPMSYHTYGRAFDYVFRDPKTGKLVDNNDAGYAFGQKLATNFGMRGIGSGDNDHIQDASYKTWKDLPRDEYGNVKQRQQVAQTNTAPSAQPPTTTQPVLAPGGTSGGVTWQDLSSLVQR